MLHEIFNRIFAGNSSIGHEDRSRRPHSRRLRLESLEERELLSINSFHLVSLSDTGNQLHFDGTQTTWQYQDGGAFEYRDTMTVLQEQDGTASISLSAAGSNSSAQLCWQFDQPGDSNYWTVQKGSQTATSVSDILVWNGSGASPQRDFSITFWEDANGNGVLDDSEWVDSKTAYISVQWAKVSLCVDQPVAGKSDPINIEYYGTEPMDLLYLEDYLDGSVGHTYWDIRVGSGVQYSDSWALMQYYGLMNNSWGYANADGDPFLSIPQSGNFIAPGECTDNSDWDTDVYQSFSVSKISDLIGILEFTQDKIDNPGTYKLMDDQNGPANQCTTVALEALAAAGINVSAPPESFPVPLPPTLESHIKTGIAYGLGPEIQAMAPFVYGLIQNNQYSFLYKGYSPGGVGEYIAANGGTRGNFAWLSEEQLDSPLISTMLGAPVLSATAQSGNSVSLSWTQAPEATHYSVWRVDGNGQWTVVKDYTTATSHVDTNLAAGTYQYVVYSHRGAEQKISNVAEASLGASLGTPVLTATNQGNSVDLSWTTTAGASYFSVWRLTGAEWTALSSWTTETTLTDTTAPSGTHSYLVFAHSGSQQTMSNLVSATVAGSLGKPTLSATANGGNVNLSWSSVSGATHFSVWRLTGGEWTAVNPYTTATSFSDTAVPSGEHQYVVYAFNATEKTMSNIPAVTVAGTLGKPTLSATADGGNVNLSWNAVSGATHFSIWRLTGEEWTAVNPYTTATSFIDTAVPAGEHLYVAYAFNATEKTISNISIVMVSSLAKPVLESAYSGGAVNLSWSGVPGATHYSVWRLGGDEWVLLDSHVSGTFHYDWTASSGTYKYVVYAFKETEKSMSNLREVTVPPSVFSSALDRALDEFELIEV